MHAMCCAMQQGSPSWPPVPQYQAEEEEERGEEERGEEETGEEREQERDAESEEEEEEEEEVLESGLEALEEAPSTVHQVSQASQESQESEGRQGRRSAHSGYDMDTRGRIVAADNASQATCSLSHLPTKTPQLTVRYATGDDPAAFASLAAQLLLSQTPQQTSTSAATQLPDMVSRLVNTARVFPPASPCTAPVSLDNADLVAWDCSAHLQHVRRLLQMVSRLTIMAHYHIGGFLGQVISRSNAATAQERHGVLVTIANAACTDNSRRYRAILTSCGCTQCTVALRAIQRGAGGGTPCKTSEVRARFGRDHIANLTPTFFRQCIQMHATMPARHPLLTAPLEVETLSPTHARLLVVELQRAVCSLQRHGLSLPLSLGQLGLWHQFPVATHFVEAVDLVDGDGGYLVLDHIPGLGAFVQEKAPAIIWLEGMRGPLVAFRCHGHDALELEHVYHSSDGAAHHLGYEALCAARRVVAEAAAITVHTSGKVDVHGRRLICSIAAVDQQGQSTSIRVSPPCGPLLSSA